MKLATKLTLLFLLLSIIPLAVVGYLAYDNGRRTIEQNTLNHLISTTILKEDEFERWVKGNERTLRALASRPGVQEYATVMASHDLSTGSGRDPAAPEYQAAYGSILERHLTPTLEEEGGFLDLAILRGDDGLILTSTDERLEGKYRESEPFFVEGKNRTYVESVAYSLALGELVMHISTPIQDREGNLIAVLAGHADLAEMSDIMEQRSGLSASEDTYLVNKFNFFVTEPRFGKGYALKKAVHTEGVQACLQHNDGVGFYDDYRGVPVIGAYRWMPERELCILTEVDQAEAYAPIVALRNTVLGIGAAVAVVVAILGVFFARTITGPLRQLVVGAEEIGRGNLEYRIEVGARDEIGQLAGAFNEMTAKLREAQDQLVRREKLAVLGQLAGGVGHELRNPLGAIKNAAYFLNMVLEEPEPEVKETLEILEKEVATSEKIISSLLDFARAKPPMQRKVDVNHVVQEALSRATVPGNVEVVSQLDEALPVILADPDQLAQVFRNIILNGIQAMPEGGQLAIKTSEVFPKPPKSEVLISFADTGVGIPEENLERLFEPLFTTKAKGIGLGLAVTRTLVEGHGGTIEVESEVGKGSTFTVKLPIGRGPALSTAEGEAEGEQK